MTAREGKTIMDDGKKWTVCILEPCCALTEPWTGGRATCMHHRPRIPTVKVYTDKGEALVAFARTRGFWSLDGWMVEGDYPRPAFRISPVAEDPARMHHSRGAIEDMPFPTVEAAQNYADRWHEWPDGGRWQFVLYDVTDEGGRVVYSSYGRVVGIGEVV